MNGYNEDGTVMMPTPGGRSGGARPAAAAEALSAFPPAGHGAPPPSSVGAHGASQVTPASVGGNRLLNAAAPLLGLVQQLRHTPSHSDIEGLLRHAGEQIRAFEQRARGAGVGGETLNVARYILCTVLDEAVLSTPWGSRSVWRQHNLLVSFHRESWGGEKFFLILQKVMQEPGPNIELLELLDVCLALGFQGQFQVRERGGVLLEELRDRVFQTIRLQRGEYERELSPHWRGVPERRNALTRYVPLWVVAALAGAVLLALYLGFGFVLEQRVAPVEQTLQAVGRPAER